MIDQAIISSKIYSSEKRLEELQTIIDKKKEGDISGQ